MRFVIIIAAGVVAVVVAATAAALKLHVKDRFTRRPHTHTPTHFVFYLGHRFRTAL